MPNPARPLLAALCLLPLSTAAAARGADAILGTWATQDGNLVIKVYDAGPPCNARIVFGAVVVEPDGTTLKKDKMNPDPSLRGRSLEGVDFVSGLTWDAEDLRWEDGAICQAATGGTASARASVQGDRVDLRAYRGTPIAGRRLEFYRRSE